MKGLSVFISGQKYFGETVLRLCLNKGIKVVGVCCPLGDKYIGRLASINNIPILQAGTLNASTMPEGVDLGITAHSFDYIGKATRYKTRLGWIGYHPSLLPRHRGRSSIEWTIKMRDLITGGTVFWLNGGIDRGDIALQDWCWVPKKILLNQDVKKAAGQLWREELLPIGEKLMDQTLNDIIKGTINKTPQQKEHSTFEPHIIKKDLYRPDSLMIEERSGFNNW